MADPDLQPSEYRLRWKENMRPTLFFFAALALLVVLYTWTLRPDSWIPALLIVLLGVLLTTLSAARSRAFLIRITPEGISAPNHRHIPWDRIIDAEEVERRSGLMRYRSYRIRYHSAKKAQRTLYVPPELEDYERFQVEVDDRRKTSPTTDLNDPHETERPS